MEKVIEFLLNRMRNNDLVLLFGENTRIKVNYLKYLTTKKIHHIDCKLYVGSFNEEEFIVLYPDSINSIIYEVWNFIGNYEPLSITLSYE